MRKIHLALSFVVLIIIVSGCITTPARPQKPISDLFESRYIPDYSHTPQVAEQLPAGYTIGVLDMSVSVTFKGKPYSAEEYGAFIKQCATGIEQILIAKGCGTMGPFDSYNGMTYPDRTECTYLIRPTLDIVLHSGSSGPLMRLPDYRTSVQVGEHVFQHESYTVIPWSDTFQCSLKYEIYEPLTGQKLAIHDLEIDPVSIASDVIVKRTYLRTIIDNRHIEDTDGEHTTLSAANAPGYYNNINVYNKACEQIYQVLMEKIPPLLSTEEFTRLDKYKKELEERVRFNAPN